MCAVVFFNFEGLIDVSNGGVLLNHLIFRKEEEEEDGGNHCSRYHTGDAGLALHPSRTTGP